MIAIDVLKWPGVNQAFIVSLVAALALTLAVIPYGKRRKIGQPTTWGEAMLGSTYAFGVLWRDRRVRVATGHAERRGQAPAHFGHV